jgi:predicted permease
MIKNYLTTALRALWRSKGSTIINISGLTLGITASLVLFLLIRDQQSYDTYHVNRDRIYRVVSSTTGNAGRNYSAGVPAVLPEAVRTDFPEAEQVVFTSYRSGGLVTIPEGQGDSKKFDGRRLVYTQPAIFDLFDRTISGGGAASLNDPNTALISYRAAEQYFGQREVLGKTLIFEGHEFKITGMVSDAPANTDFGFDVFLSYVTIRKKQEENGWNSIWSDEQCYVLLRPEVSASSFSGRFPAFATKHHGDNIEDRQYELQSLADIHFDDRYGNYNYSTTSREMLLALSIIGVFLVLTACINFINLVTAESIKRSKEVGIRKTLGSSRRQLVIQFLGESGLVTGIAVALSLAVTQMVLGFLNPFLGLSLHLNLIGDSGLLIFLAVITLGVGLLSGIYPALVVSGFKPIFAIKNQINDRNSSGFQLRRGLVVFQFFISQLFIMGTIVLISQMNYFQSKDLGFNKEAIVTIPVPENERLGFADGSSKMKTLREEVQALAGVVQTSLSNTPPSSGSVSSTDFKVEGNDQSFGTQVKVVDGNYLDLFGLKLVAGKNLPDLDTARGFVVNEKLAAMVGFTNPNEIIGKRIKMWGKTLPVDGVVQDFHTMSLHEPVEATILLNRVRSYSLLSVKLSGTDWPSTLKAIQTKWEGVYPEAIYSYRFLDEEIREFYDRESKMSTLLTMFTSVAIFIGCLGLFGLATFMANQKTKEIGVRKVLGASAESIVVLFSKEYLVLIAVGFLLAAPVAWYLMNQWLNGFAYKITIGPGVFLAGIGLTLLIAMATVGYRSVKAALANPADSLRSE